MEKSCQPRGAGWAERLAKRPLILAQPKWLSDIGAREVGTKEAREKEPSWAGEFMVGAGVCHLEGPYNR